MLVIREIYRLYGAAGFIRLLVYPWSLLVTAPVSLARTVFSIITGVISYGAAGMSRLSIYRSYNSAYHRMYDFFMTRYGRHGYAYTMGLGQGLRTKFQLNKISMWLYSRYEALVPPLGVFGCWGMFVFCYQMAAVNRHLFLAVSVLFVLSGIWYFCAFDALKYDALGWIFVPLAFWSLLSGSYYIYGLSLLAISLLSLSVFIPLFAVLSVLGTVIAPAALVFMVPSLIKVMMHFTFILRNPKSLLGLAGLLGATKKGKKARRMSLGIYEIYYLVIWLPFCAMLVLAGRETALFPLYSQILLAAMVIGLFVINKLIARFADTQTLLMLALSSFSVITVYQAQWVLLPFLFIAINPLPFIMGFGGEPRLKPLDYLPFRRPEMITDAQQRIKEFIRPVPAFGRVLFVFDYQPGRHPTFSGYRPIKELAHEALAQKDAILFPDWYSYQDHYAGLLPLDRIFGGKSLPELTDGMQIIRAGFAVVPSADSTLPASWQNAGYSVAAVLDLRSLVPRDAGGKALFPEEMPFWILVKAGVSDIPLCDDGELVGIGVNKIQCRVGTSGQMTIRFMFDPGWKTADSGVTVAAGSPVPWIMVQARPGTLCTIYYTS